MDSSDKALIRILRRSVDIQELIDNLDFQDEQIIASARMQPTLFLKATRFRIQKMRELAAAEANDKLVRSQKSLALRQKYRNSSERMTEAAIAAMVSKKSEVQEADRALADAEQAEEFAKLLLEAYRQRRDVLEVISRVVGAEAYIGNRHHGELEQLRSIVASKYSGVKKGKKKGHSDATDDD